MEALGNRSLSTTLKSFELQTVHSIDWLQAKLLLSSSIELQITSSQFKRKHVLICAGGLAESLLRAEGDSYYRGSRGHIASVNRPACRADRSAAENDGSIVHGGELFINETMADERSRERRPSLSTGTHPRARRTLTGRRIVFETLIIWPGVLSITTR